MKYTQYTHKKILCIQKNRTTNICSDIRLQMSSIVISNIEMVLFLKAGKQLEIALLKIWQTKLSNVKY